MHVFGVTGGVGCGKSTVLSMLSEDYKSYIIMADDVCKELEEYGQPGYIKLVEKFGDVILSEDGALDKRKFAEIIFSSDEARETANSILHPLTKERIIEYIELARKSKKYDFCFIEAALLIEAGYTSLCEETWYVYSSVHKRIERLMSSRGYTEDKCISIMKNQLSEDSFRENCDFILDNSYDLDYTRLQISKKLSQYLD